MVKHISQTISVMYLGNVVETGGCNEIYHHPLHPYTKALLSAVPVPDRMWPGAVSASTWRVRSPAPSIPPAAAPSAPLPLRPEDLRGEKPALREVGGGRQVACHVVD